MASRYKSTSQKTFLRNHRRWWIQRLLWRIVYVS